MEGGDAKKVVVPTSSPIAPVIVQESMAEFMAMMQTQFATMSATFLEKLGSIEKKQEILGSTIEATNTALGDFQIQTSNQLTQLEQDIERQEAAVDRLPSLGARSSHLSSVSERRKSMTFNFANLDAEESKDDAVQRVEVKEFVIDRDRMLNNVTMRNVMALLQYYKEYQQTSRDKNRKLVEFLTAEAQALLVDNEEMLATDLSCHQTYENFCQVSNAILGKVLSNYLRPTTPAIYKRMLAHSITPLKANHHNWVFGTRNYYKYMWRNISRLIRELLDIDRICRQGDGSNYNVAECLPLVNWGSSAEPGVIRIFMKCLRPFEQNFQQLVGYEQLKNCTSTEDWATLMKTASDKLARQSMQLEQVDARLKTPEKLEDTIEAAFNEIQQIKFSVGKKDRSVPQDNEPAHLKACRLNRIAAQDEEDFEEQFAIALEHTERVATPGDKTLTPTKLPFTKDLRCNRPCWSLFFHGKCDYASRFPGKTCDLSHDRAVLEAYATKLAKQALESPFGGKKLLEKILAEPVSQDVRQRASTGGPYGSKFFAMETDDEDALIALTQRF
jgi:hypothetical protein